MERKGRREGGRRRLCRRRQPVRCGQLSISLLAALLARSSWNKKRVYKAFRAVSVSTTISTTPNAPTRWQLSGASPPPSSSSSSSSSSSIVSPSY